MIQVDKPSWSVPHYSQLPMRLDVLRTDVEDASTPSRRAANNRVYQAKKAWLAFFMTLTPAAVCPAILRHLYFNISGRSWNDKHSSVGILEKLLSVFLGKSGPALTAVACGFPRCGRSPQPFANSKPRSPHGLW